MGAIARDGALCRREVDAEAGEHDEQRYAKRAEIERQKREEEPIEFAMVLTWDVREDDGERSQAAQRVDGDQTPARRC